MLGSPTIHASLQDDLDKSGHLNDAAADLGTPENFDRYKTYVKIPATGEKVRILSSFLHGID